MLLSPRFPPWPKLDWRCPSKPGPWLEKRTFEVAALTRRFELAFTVLAEEGKLDLADVDDPLLEWDMKAAEILVFTVWGESKRVPTDPGFASRLEKIYATIEKARLRVLEGFGRDKGRLVADREAQLPIDTKSLRPAPSSPMPATFARFTGEFEGVAATPDLSKVPVSGDEVLKRGAAEAKPLPESRNLGALLANQPSEWISAIFEHLALKLDEDAELSAGSRSAVRRGAIFEHLRDAANLEKVLASLEAPSQSILFDLLDHEGWLPYRKLISNVGLDESDGFYWNTRPPSGPLAVLRRKGLAFVGTRNGTAMVSLPLDLADKIRELLPNQAPG